MPETQYRTVTTINASGGRTIVHTPIRTAREQEQWLRNLDAAVREALPGRRLVLPTNMEPPFPPPLMEVAD